jgi:hypothetical protein
MFGTVLLQSVQMHISDGFTYFNIPWTPRITTARCLTVNQRRAPRRSVGAVGGSPTYAPRLRNPELGTLVECTRRFTMILHLPRMIVSHVM